MAKKYVLPAIFTAEDKLSAKVSKMTSKVQAKMDILERKWRKSGDKAMAAGKKYAIAGAMIVAPMVLLANEAVKFESQMSNVNTLIDESVESIDKMGDKVLELSTRLPVPIEELTASLYDIRSAGISAADQFTTLEVSAKLSAAGLSDVSESTDILTSALNAFKSQGLSAEQTADILFKTVKNGKTTLSQLSQAFGATAPVIQSAGIRLEDFSAATAAITTTGTPAAQAQNQIRASVVSLIKPSEQMTKIFKKLGVASGKDLVEKYGSLGKAYSAINQKSKELNLNNGKVWRSTESLAAVTSITGSTNEAYVNTLTDMTKGTNALNKAYEKQAGTGKASMQILKNQLQSTAITLGQALIPMIVDLGNSVTPMIKRFAEWVKRNKGLVSTIGKVAATIAALSFALSGINFLIGIFYRTLGLASTIMRAYQSVVKIATTLQLLWNVALNANPIGLVIIAVAALTAGVYLLTKAYNKQSDAQRLNNELNSRALENSVDQRVEVTMLFGQLKRLTVGSEQYNSVLSKIDAIQPGITDKYNLQAGAIRDMAAAERELTKNIYERAKAEARVELIKEKIKKSETLKQEKGGGFWEMAGDALSPGMGTALGKYNRVKESRQLDKDAQFLINQEADYQMSKELPAPESKENVNVEKSSTETTNTNNENVFQKIMLEFKNAPEGMKATTTGSGVGKPQMTTTR